MADPLGLLAAIGKGGGSSTNGGSGGGSGSDPLGLLGTLGKGGGSSTSAPAPTQQSAPATSPKLPYWLATTSVGKEILANKLPYKPHGEGIFGQIAHIVQEAPVGVAKALVVAPAQEAARTIGGGIHEIEQHGLAPSWSKGDAAFPVDEQAANHEHPFTMGIVHSEGRTRSRLQGLVTGHNVYGGKTNHSVADVLEDFANLALPFDVGGHIAESAATDAAATAAEHQSAAEAAAKAAEDAAKFHEGLSRAAATGDPAAAAQSVSARAAAERAASAQAEAEATAAQSAERAARIAQTAAKLKTIAAVGNKAAASPFAPTFGLAGRVLREVVPQVLEHIGQTGIGEKLSQTLQDHAEKMNVRDTLREERMQEQRDQALAARSEKVRSDILGNDETMKSAQQLYAEGIPHGIAKAYAGAPEHVRDALAEQVAATDQLGKATPEMAHMALQAATGERPDLRAAFDAATEHGKATLGAKSSADYVAERGEMNPQPAGKGYREWNVDGRSPRLQPQHEAELSKIDRLRVARQTDLEKAQAALEAKLAKHPEGPLPKDAAEFTRKVHEPVQKLAAIALRPENHGVFDALVDDPTFGTIAKQIKAAVEKGKDPTTFQARLGDTLLRSLDAKPENLSPASEPIVEGLRNALPDEIPKYGAARSVPRLTDLEGVEKAARAQGEARAAQGRLDFAARLIGRSTDQMSEAESRIARDIADDPKVVSASNRLVQRAQRLERMARKVRETSAAERELDPYKVAQTTEKAMAKDVRATRTDVKAMLNHVADDMESELREADADLIKRPPSESSPTFIRKGDLKGRDVLRSRLKSSGEYEGWEHLPEWIKRKYATEPNELARGEVSRGHSLEQLTENFKTMRNGARLAGAAQDSGLTLNDWIDHVTAIRDLRELAKRSADRGWDPHDEGFSHVRSLLGDVLGYSPEYAEHYLTGTPQEAAANLVHGVAAEARQMRVAPPDQMFAGDQGGDVARALEARLGGDTGPGRVLDQPGKAALNTESAKLGQLGAQGKVSEQQQRVVDMANAQAERARAYGVRAGEQLGTATAGQKIGEQVGTQAESQLAREQERAAKLPAEQVNAAAKIAGRTGRRYYAEGERAAELREAARVVGVKQRALDRLDDMTQRRYVKAMNDVAAAPSRFRPMLQVARTVAKGMNALADEADKEVPGSGDAYRAVVPEIAVTLHEAMATGVEPQHLIGGALTPPEGIAPPSAAELPRLRATGNRARKVGEIGDLEGDNRARLIAKRFVTATRNEYVKRIGDSMGQKLADALGPERVDEIKQQRAEQGNKFDVEALRNELKAATGERMTPWNPSSPFDKPVKNWSNVTPENFDSLVALPDHILKEFGRNRKWATDSTLLKAYDAANKGTKTAWLGLSGRFLTGRLIGHTVMASVGAGIDPLTIWRNMANAKRLYDMGPVADEGVLSRLSDRQRAGLDEGAFPPAELQARGEMSQLFAPKDLEASTARTPVGKVMNYTRGIAAKMDAIANLGVYLSKLDEGLSANGYKDFLERYPEFKGMPRAQVEREAAVRLTLRTLGDFSDMSPVEREVISRAVFFYPWMRHVTRLAMNLAVHNPVRTAWLLHLGDMFNGQPDTGLKWLDPAFIVGNPAAQNWLRYPGTWNPFAQLTQLAPVNDQGIAPQGALSSLSPIISGAIALGSGADPARGFLQVPRPPGSTALDPGTGAERAGPLLTHPSEAANYLAGLLPQTAALREAIPALVGHEPVIRYPTGEAIHYQLSDQPTDQTTPGGRGFAKLAALFGFPYEQHVDVGQVQRTAQERFGRQAAVRRAYARGGKKHSTTATSAPTTSAAGSDPLGLLKTIGK